MQTVEEQIKDSCCFGKGFDPFVDDCKRCGAKNACENLCRLNHGVNPLITKPAPTVLAEPQDILDPESSKTQSETPKPRIKEVVKKKEKTKNVEYDPNMPVFKDMSLEDLLDLANKRGAQPGQFDQLTNVSYKRMRVIMFLKTTNKD